MSTDDFVDDVGVRRLCRGRTSPAVMPIELSPTSDAAADAGARMIGTTLMHNKLTDAAKALTASDFVRADHSAVWRLFEKLTENDQCITAEAINTLAAQRGETARLPGGGGEGWQREFMSLCVLPQIEPQMVALVKAESTRHKIEAGLTDVLCRTRSGAPASEVIEDVARLAAHTAALATADAPITHTADTVTEEKITWITPGILAVGETTSFLGAPGSAKSTVATDVAARVSTGRTQYGATFARPAADVLIVSPEESHSAVLVPRLRVAGADLSRVHLWPQMDLLSFPGDVDRFVAEVNLHNVKLVVLDPVASTLAEKLCENSNKDVRTALTPLIVALRAVGCACIWIRHTNKSRGVSAQDRGAGSGAFVALSRTEMMFGHADEDLSVFTMACGKTNSKMPQAIQFRLAEVGDVPRVEYLGRTDTTANDLCADPMVRAARATAKSDAVEKIILDIGADGRWHSSAELEHAVKQVGGSIATIKRMKKDLGVKSDRQKQPPRAWYWYLPTGAYPAPLPLEAHLGGVSARLNEPLQSDETLPCAPRRNEPLQSNNNNYLDTISGLGNVEAHQDSDTPLLNEPLHPKEADEPLRLTAEDDLSDFEDGVLT